MRHRGAADSGGSRERVRERAERLRRRELDRALCRLEAQGELTDEQRRTVARMTAAVVDGVLAAPEAALDSECDSDVKRSVADIFAGEA